MKLPKSKTGLFVVCRHVMAAEEGIPVGIFLTHESADNYAGACEQQMLEKGLSTFNFRVHYVIFYNE